MRQRLLHETEVALLYGLRFPKRSPRIPIMEVGSAEWHPAFAAQFWQDALDLDESDPLARKMQALLWPPRT
jgi:hypothetical protein